MAPRLLRLGFSLPRKIDMAKFSFSDIENAFMFVNSAMYGMNSALLCKDAGKILYRSDMSGIDEMAEEEELDLEQCVEIPHKNDLNLPAPDAGRLPPK